MTDERKLPVGKLPPDLLAALLQSAPTQDERLVVRPGVGEDVAAVDCGDHYMILKTDPITFATRDAGWYLANVNANDIATAGARASWCLVTALLPENKTTPALVRDLFENLSGSLQRLGITLCGGHTEITHGLERVILVGMMVGETPKDRLVDKRRTRPGDIVLLTKWVPVEGAALIARERPEGLAETVGREAVERAADFLYDPGISIMEEALAAADAAPVHAMHDVTEGGLITGLRELAAATGTGLELDADAVPVAPLARRLCRHFDLDPLGLISSGALLIVTDPSDADTVTSAVRKTGVDCTRIATLTDQPGRYIMTRDGERGPMPEFERDEIGRLFS